MNILQKSSTRAFSGRLIIPLLFLLVPLTALLSLSLGVSDVSIADGVRALVEGNTSDISYRILFQIRLPRVLGALLAGSALAVSGVIIQAVLNNPLAAPNLIGVNAGAGFFVIVTMALLPRFIKYLPVSAFVGALLTAILIYVVSAVTGAGRITVTLVGVAVGSILTSGINTVKILFPDSVYDVTGYLIGGMSSVDPSSIIAASVMILPSLALAVIFSRNLDVLSLGEEMASGLGVRVKTARLMWLVLAAVLAGAAVSFAGLLGFVGLIVPHVVRRFSGNVHRYLVPCTIFGGGIFLLVADTVARVAFLPYELPVGILLSLAGGPFFILLILSERRRED